MRTGPNCSQIGGVARLVRSTRGVSAALSIPLAIALLALVPVGAGTAQGASPVPGVSVVEVPAGELGPILSSVPIGDLGLDESELGGLLSQLAPGLETSATGLEEAVAALLASNPSATLGELVESLLGQSGGLGALIGSLVPELDSGQILSLLNPEQIGTLLDNLTGGQPQGALDLEELAQLLEERLGALAGQQRELIEGLLAALNSGTATLSPTTLGALAEQAGTSSQALAEDVGLSAQTLPSTAPALAIVGEKGPLAGVLKGASGLAVTVLSGQGSAGGEGGSGSPGPAGGVGSTGVAGTPAPAGPAPRSVPVAPAKKASAKRPAKVRILSHKVRHGVASIVVQAPAAGKLTFRGKHLKVGSRKVRAGRVKLRLKFAKSAVAAARKHRHPTRVRLLVSFTPTKGAQRSSASATLSFG